MSDRVQIYSKKWRGKSCQLAELLAPWRAWSGQTIISKKERESNRAKKEVIERKLLRKKGSYWEKVIAQKRKLLRKSYLAKKGKKLLASLPASNDRSSQKKRETYWNTWVKGSSRKKLSAPRNNQNWKRKTGWCDWQTHNWPINQKLSLIIETSSASQHLMIERISAGTLICTFVELNWRYVSLLMSFDFHTKYIFGYILISFVVYI